MSEEQAGTQNTTEAEKATAGGNASEERVYKQADLDAITEKVRATEAKRVAALEKELASLREKSMTEQEKAIKEAEERGKGLAAQEWRGKAIRTALIASGMDAEKAASAANLAPADVDDPAEAVAKLRETWPELFGGQKRAAAPGGDLPRSGTPTADEWTDERIDAVIRSGQYAKYRDQIERARLERVRKAGGYISR